MVAPVENLTRLTGVIRHRVPHERLAEWDVVTLAVERAEAVPGAANLLAARASAPMLVAVRRELLDACGPGWRLSCRAKLVPDGAMCEARPKPGDFQLDPPG